MRARNARDHALSFVLRSWNELQRPATPPIGASSATRAAVIAACPLRGQIAELARSAIRNFALHECGRFRITFAPAAVRAGGPGRVRSRSGRRGRPAGQTETALSVGRYWRAAA